MNKRIIKIIIDVCMLVVMVLEFSKIYTGQLLHEIFGVTLLVLIVAHNVLNINFYKNIFKGKYNARRIVTTIVNLLFLFFMTVTIILGIPISQNVFSFLNMNGNMTTRTLHTIFGYWSLIFLSIHLGLHFNMIFVKLKGKKIFYILELIILIYGIYIMLNTNLFEHLIGVSSFSVPQGNIVVALINNLCMVASIAFIVYNIIKLPGKKEK